MRLPRAGRDSFFSAIRSLPSNLPARVYSHVFLFRVVDRSDSLVECLLRDCGLFARGLSVFERLVFRIVGNVVVLGRSHSAVCVLCLCGRRRGIGHLHGKSVAPVSGAGDSGAFVTCSLFGAWADPGDGRIFSRHADRCHGGGAQPTSFCNACFCGVADAGLHESSHAPDHALAVVGRHGAGRDLRGRQSLSDQRHADSVGCGQRFSL